MAMAKSGEMTASERDAEWDERWTRVVDVIVVGSGAAGFAAALSAAAAGSSVLLLEKADVLGGTTAISSAAMWIPDNPLMEAKGISDPREDALHFLAHTSYPTLYNKNDTKTLGLGDHRFSLIEALFDEGRPAYELLKGMGALPVDADNHPIFTDYYAEDPANRAPVGRTIMIEMPEGHRPGVDETGGQIMIQAMARTATALGVDVLTSTRVTELIKDEAGAVVGVAARSRSGADVFGARRGVVFASGGFVHDVDLVRAHLRGPILGSSGSRHATGDFVRIGSDAGAALGNMSQAWWDQVVVEAAARSRVTSQDAVSLYGDSMIVVNGQGTRVVNEKRPYNDRGQVHHRWDAVRSTYGDYLLFMIFDDAVLNDVRGARHRYPVPGDQGGWEVLISADTLAALTDAIDARLSVLAPSIGDWPLDAGFLSNLRVTIERFNAMAVAGVDEEYGRGESAIERSWATTPRDDGQTNPTMYPISSTGPFHCVVLGPGALDTKGGPVIDARGRVLAHDRSPIEGLYGAGNCIASPTGEAYYGPGATIGAALTFGVIAGSAASARAAHAPCFSDL